jgi:hypothetical protein
MFAVNTLSFDRLLNNYISDSQNHVITSIRPSDDFQETNNLFGTDVKSPKKKKHQ